jgi:glyoxylase-like metal-dependent hydrolase (beta-lactamase superfamily II)
VLDIAETALHQVERLRFSGVRHVVLTHLDLDHAGGLRGFPDAQVHVLRTELEAARAARSGRERTRNPRLSGRRSRGGPRTTRRATSGSASRRCATFRGCRRRSCCSR